MELRSRGIPAFNFTATVRNESHLSTSDQLETLEHSADILPNRPQMITSERHKLVKGRDRYPLNKLTLPL
jgi:hypothetical protein